MNKEIENQAEKALQLVQDRAPFDEREALLLRRLARDLFNHSETLEVHELERILFLARQGHYPRSRLSRDPGLSFWLLQSPWLTEAMSPDEMWVELDQSLQNLKEDHSNLGKREIQGLLRAFRHRQLLRIFLREIEGSSLRQTTAEVADVASTALSFALREAGRLHSFPEEIDEEITIFGMGKLGGRELNFSSDVDLVFACSDEAYATWGSEKLEALVRTTVELMDEVTDDGRVFRVDLRLRPEGGRGRLILSRRATVDYFLSWGRTWERGAWLKARPVAGNIVLGEEMLRELEPFLFRRHLDYEAIDELRRMKEMIDHEAQASRVVRQERKSAPAPNTIAKEATSSPLAQRLKNRISGSRAPLKTSPFQAFKISGSSGAGHQKGSPGDEEVSDEDDPATPLDHWNVKTGKGGIREIEFFVQALQLVHCGTRTGLRVRTTLDALDRLLYAGLISGKDHSDLADSYDLLRRVEHRVQMELDRQAHRLPAGEKALQEFACRMEMNGEELQSILLEARERVEAIFERLFSESPRRPEEATVGEEAPGLLEQLVSLPPEGLLEEEIIEGLKREGFERPRQVAGHLQVLRSKDHGPFSANPRHADLPVARYLLRSIQSAPDSEAALANLVRFATTIGHVPSVWAILATHPHASRLLIHLFGSSPPLARLLADEPEVFERLIYSGSAQMVREKRAMERELAQKLEGIDDRARKMGRIRRFHREELVRIALHEVAGTIPVEKTCEQLSFLAEVVLEFLFREVIEEYGLRGELSWEGDALFGVSLGIIGMGKLGSREMGFGSDLDFFFVYSEEQGLTHQSATRIARRFVKALSAAREIGGLYEVDLRLRPSGSQGTLVVSLEAWENYHRQRAHLWERQALVRARALTGSEGLRSNFEERRVDLCFRRSLAESSRKEVGEMRAKIDWHRGPGFDVKRSPGGLLDLEFLSQWIQLSTGHEQGLFWTPRSTAELLKEIIPITGTLPELDQALEGIDVGGLLRDYRWLRRLECRLQISGLGVSLPQEGGPRRALIRQMGHQGRDGEDAFVEELKSVQSRVSEAFQRVFELPR